MAYTTIDKPSDYFNTKLYTGSRPSQSITGVGFQPDWVWLKQRDDSNPHRLFDVIRGATKNLSSNSTDAESTQSPTLTSFNSDGFSLGDSGSVNNNGSPHVSWNWKAGTSFSNSAGANGATIASTGSVNQDAGFSIVSYTGNATNGAKVGHGLSSAPQMVITKSRGDAGAWQILTNIYSSYSEGDYIALNTTDAKANSANVSFLPTSTTWQMKSGQAGNTSSTKIAYCFHSVQGYSKFSSYTGNGNADGTFVYTGFKPAFILAKDADSSDNWIIHDTTRNPSNPVGAYLRPNLSSAEGTFSHYDILSNGFKNLYAGGSLNGSGKNIIYMAFAKNPFVTSTGVPATAR